MLFASFTSYLMLLGMAPTTPQLADETQIMLECRIITAPDGVMAQSVPRTKADSLHSSIVLTGNELDAMLEKMREHRSANVSQLPRLTLLNGQNATVRFPSEIAPINGSIVFVPRKDIRESEATLSARVRDSGNIGVDVRLQYHVVRWHGGPPLRTIDFASSGDIPKSQTRLQLRHCSE